LKALKKGVEEGLGLDGDGSGLSDWTIRARGGAGRRRSMETRGRLVMNRAVRESLDRIERDLETAGANRRDYRFRSYDGRDVAQRDSTFEPYQRNQDGTTNMVRMFRGEPPRDREGETVVLHHSSQLNKGPYVEMTRSEHRAVPIRREPSGINRSEHNSFRIRYWKQRAKEISER
jgi:hypothetical protein